MTIAISAIVCTHNRADFVLRAIESLAGQTLKADDYEILVVDNASDDRTREVVETRSHTIPNLAYLYEPRAGLSNARNAGLAASKGRILAFLDDDAIACTGWLEEILRVFQSIDPHPGLLCGPVEPIWGAPRPDWLDDDLLSFYSALDWSEMPRRLEESEWIVGANFAVPRDIAHLCGGFDERLGRKGKSLLSGEDTAISDKVRSAGYDIYYEPAMRVRHYVHPERLSKSWLYRRVFWGAVTKGMRDRESTVGTRERSRYVFDRVKHFGRRLLTVFRASWVGARRMQWMRHLVNDIGWFYGFLLLGR